MSVEWINAKIVVIAPNLDDPQRVGLQRGASDEAYFDAWVGCYFDTVSESVWTVLGRAPDEEEWEIARQQLYIDAAKFEDNWRALIMQAILKRQTPADN